VTTLAAQPAKAITLPACAHCGLDVPRGLIKPDAEDQFCCNGCEAAYEAIRACGLGEYYALKQRLAEEGEAARSGPGRYAEFDDPAFAERHVGALQGGESSVELYIEGVHCAACVWLLEKLPSIVPGVTSCEVDLARRTARVVWDPTRVRLSNIAIAFDRFGYVPHPVEPSVQRDARRNEDRAYMIRIGVAAACAGNVMLLAFALYSGEFDAMGEPYMIAFRWLSAAIGILAVVWPGWVFMRGALAAARARVWRLDMPIAAAIGIGAIAGLVQVIRGSSEIYFDSITMLIFLLLVGRWLQLRQQRRASDAIEMLFSVTPRRVHLVREGVAEDASIDAVKPGDLVEVLPHESVPVDGIIESGRTTADNAMLSGQSMPVPLGVGDAVSAGAVNLGATIRVRVEAAGRDTRVGRLMQDIERLGRSRVPLIGSAERIAGPFIGFVFTASIVCLLARLHAGWDAAIESVIALLIVCCPCAAALATPMATSIAIGRLARRGILVKGGDTFETLAAKPTLILDKTGTLTEGRFELRRWIGDESLRPAVAAIESGSTHPIARALSQCDEPTHADDIEHLLGLGATGFVRGERITAGSAKLMVSLGIEIPVWATDEAAIAASTGQTAVLIARDDAVEVVAILGDAIRDDIPAALAVLRARGWNAELCSGDHPDTVAAVARSLNIDNYTGGASPEDKLARVKESAARGPTVMVGDGVNDAPALAAATVGVSVSGGAEASLAAADVYLSEPGLQPLADLAAASRSATGRIRLCLTFALCYNGIAAGLAIAGFMTPLLAAIIMPISSLTVLSIALGAGKMGTRQINTPDRSTR